MISLQVRYIGNFSQSFSIFLIISFLFTMREDSRQKITLDLDINLLALPCIICRISIWLRDLASYFQPRKRRLSYSLNPLTFQPRFDLNLAFPCTLEAYLFQVFSFVPPPSFVASMLSQCVNSYNTFCKCSITLCEDLFIFSIFSLTISTICGNIDTVKEWLYAKKSIFKFGNE